MAPAAAKPASEVRSSRSSYRCRTGPRTVALLLGTATLLCSACAIPRWPVDGSLISPFGVRWEGWLPGVHAGVDLEAPEGTEVRTMAPGRVRFAGTMGSFGNVVWIDHGETILTVYAHLSEIHVTTGEEVSSRQVLGLSGSTGDARGAHLHFEVWRWGRQVDPVPLIGSLPGG